MTDSARDPHYDLHSLPRIVLFQSFLNRAYLTLSEGLEIVENVNEALKVNLPSTVETFEREILNINRQILELMDMQIVRVMDQEATYVLINDVSDEHAKLGSVFTASEILFVKALVDEFFENSKTHYATASPENANKRLDLQDRLTASQALAAVDTLLQEGWLNYDPATKQYQPSVRLTTELEMYLRQKFGPDGTNSLANCSGCDKIIVSGISCPSQQCGLIYHKGCFDRINPSQCPKCSTSLS